jgi:drug/metabolite transporter (DMT)-like permease
VPQPKHNVAIAGSLLFVVFLWGGNNAGTKWLVAAWPPIWTGGIRFLLAGLLLLAVLRFTSWLGEYHPLTSGLLRSDGDAAGTVAVNLSEKHNGVEPFYFGFTAP